jgi:predicted metalloprotease
MQWGNNRESDNVEDVRSSSGAGGFGGGRGGGFGGSGRGGLLMGLLSGRLGIGTVVVVLVGSYFLGINPLTVLGFLDGGQVLSSPQQSQPQGLPINDIASRQVKEVLGTTEDIWSAQFQAAGAQYRPAKLVLFRKAYPTACGQGQSAMGPFYCPADQKIYIDLDFYQTLKNQLGAPGEFAQAYVIAHEVGHHVQHLLGITTKVDAQRGRISQIQQNELSVRLELQADCLAGVWGFHSKDKFKITQQDVQDAMNAASKIGDDALQRASTGAVRPESFTHGTSAQRVRWFNAGLQSGDMRRCDTFNTRDL